MKMKIEKDTVACLYYTLWDAKKKEIIQEMHKEESEEYYFGKGMMLDYFEEKIFGLGENDTFDFVIPCDEAYGPVDPSAIFDLPNSAFEDENGQIEEGVLQIGNIFPMQDNEGNRHNGKLIKIMQNSVTMDFNHPLAGKDLQFQGGIVSVRKTENLDQKV